jgi:2-deoxy-D-gluconate 3-dehydrogenase
MPTTQLFDLSGRVALVTGGNGGIGRSIAIGLAKAGAAVGILARNEEKNQHVLGELQALGVRSLAVRVDVTERGQLQPALEKVEETLGPVCILVNNAGISRGSAKHRTVDGVLDHTLEDWDRVIETNLTACFLLSKLTAKSMVKRREGKIINIASMYAIFGSGVVPAYSATKGAIVQLTKSMAIELAPFNIQVNAIAPDGLIQIFWRLESSARELRKSNCADARRSLGQSRRMRRNRCVFSVPSVRFCHRRYHLR